MNRNLDYKKATEISLKESSIYNEKWLQDKIEEDPRILGLGNLILIDRERRQSSGGRIDFLFRNEDTDTLFEVEVQLGRTDESHIIRAIEYWDIERRKNPSYDHRAVIVAEDISYRFFNVMYLMNRSIPIIAIQVKALQVDNSIVLHFTQVLDIYEVPEDEIDYNTSVVEASYWAKEEYQASIEIKKRLLSMVDNELETKETHNRDHIAIGSKQQNFLWFHPRTSGRMRVHLRVKENNVEEIRNKLEDLGISATLKERPRNCIELRFDLIMKQINEKTQNTLSYIIKKGFEDSHIN